MQTTTSPKAGELHPTTEELKKQFNPKLFKRFPHRNFGAKKGRKIGISDMEKEWRTEGKIVRAGKFTIIEGQLSPK